MSRGWRRRALACFSLGLLSACLTNEPDPDASGIYACVGTEDCPGEQACLQGVCEAVALPVVTISSPEDLEALPFGTEHQEVLSLTGANLTLRPLSESSEAIPGEGHIVVFVDEVEVLVIDSGNLGAGIQEFIDIPDTPGVHYIRAQARLNDGSDYDNPEGSGRNLVWVDDGREHVALRRPWLRERFGLDEQSIEVEIEVLGGMTVGPPSDTEAIHAHIYYDQTLPECLDMPLCEAGYNGVVPSNAGEFGPIPIPASEPGPATISASLAESGHTVYLEESTMMPVVTEVTIFREALP